MRTKFYLLLVVISLSAFTLQSCGNKSTQGHENLETESSEDSSDETFLKKGARKLLEADIRKSNRLCPIQAGPGITITKIEMSDRYVTYKAECDESQVSIAALKVSGAEVKQNIIEALRSEGGMVENAFINLLKKSNTGLIYNYVGDTSGNTCSVRIEANEL